MKKNNSIKKISIIELLIFACWCVVVLVFADYNHAGFYLWAGFGFGVCHFVVAALSLFFVNTKNNRSTTELSFIPVYYTAAYLLISVCIDTYFIFRVSGDFNVLLVGINLVVLAFFIGIRIYTDSYVDRVDKQTRHIAEQTGAVASVQSLLSVIIGSVNDPDLKKQLIKLKETVDYSSNMSQQFTMNAQNQMMSVLNQIQVMVSQKENKHEIIEKINEASSIWKSRNSLASTIK